VKLRLQANRAAQPAARTAWWLVVVLVVLAVVAKTLAVPLSYVGESDLVLIAAFGAYGLNLVTGYAGQASIGNAGFMVIGGLSGWWIGKESSNFLLALLGGAVAGLVTGAIVGAIALRWRGFYLVLATLAVQSIAVFVMQQIQLQDNSPYLGGFAFEPASLFGHSITTDRDWFVVLAVLLAIVIVLIGGVVDGRFGRAWMAVRENEGAAAVCGINVVWMKIMVFSIGSAVISLGGVLSGVYAASISYEGFTLDLSTTFIAMIIVGGLGSMAGPLLGAIVVTFVPYLISTAGNTGLGRTLNNLNGGTGLPFLETILYCVIVLLFLVFEPMGLVHLGGRIARLVRRARGSGSEPPPSAAAPAEPRVAEGALQ
jgi:branched-chain amino acid transport system permease protein